AQVLDAILREPPLDLGERAAVLFGMLILIAEPRFPSCRLIGPVPQDGIEWDHAETRPSRNEPSQPQRETCERVVDAEHDNAPRPREWHQTRERGPRVGRVMQNARREHDVERA